MMKSEKSPLMKVRILKFWHVCMYVCRMVIKADATWVLLLWLEGDVSADA